MVKKYCCVIQWTLFMWNEFTSLWAEEQVLSRVPVHLVLLLFTCLIMSNPLWPHGLHHTRPPCPSPTPRVYSNSCPLSRWCHPTISSSVIPFSSCLQSFPTSGSFQMSQFFPSAGQSIGASASASVLPMNIQDWFLLGLNGLISLQCKGHLEFQKYSGASLFLLLL